MDDDDLQLPVGREAPTHDEIMDDGPVSALLPDAFGNPHPCVMPKWCWHYLFWLRRRGFRITEWLKELDMVRGDYPLGTYLCDAIVEDFERRQEEGKSLPHWLKGYQ
jgi:hypothetical protein